MPHQTANIHVTGFDPLITPRELQAELPLPESAQDSVAEARTAAEAILSEADRRLIAVVGPCSIHEERAALEYAQRLKALADRVTDRILVFMRVYFEKPRTTVGWKGLINDPHLNDTFDMNTGLRLARRTLLQIAEMGLPAASEMLEPITPQYIADLIALASIGARTTESPTHRQMASGLSMPVGFKNGTDGDLTAAINAMTAAAGAHSFLGVDNDGRTAIVNTTGNPWGHLILRGGRSGANYTPEALADAAEQLKASGFPPRLIIDCSHGNSAKDYTRQAEVWNACIAQRATGNRCIMGLMLESHLQPGNQKLTGDPASLKYGVSITDACIGWDETEDLLLTAHEKLADVLPASSAG